MSNSGPRWIASWPFPTAPCSRARKSRRRSSMSGEPAARAYEVYRGVVFPWMCDHIGHMNVRWYAHHFDDAGFHLWSVAGVSQREMRERGTQVVVAQTTIKYVRELKAGDLIVIRAAFAKI